MPPLPSRTAFPLLLVTLCGALNAACGSTSGHASGSRVDYEWLPTSEAPNTDHLDADELGEVTGVEAAPWTGEVATRCRALEPVMRAAAMTHRVDLGLIAGMIHVESKFRADARSRSGARGLMQVLPSIARRLKCGDLLDPRDNLDCGLTIFRRFMARYDDELIYGLSAYNAGYRVPNEARQAGTLPSNFSYVEKVLEGRSSYLRHGCGR